jgi:hypothetical protein
MPDARLPRYRLQCRKPQYITVGSACSLGVVTVGECNRRGQPGHIAGGHASFRAGAKYDRNYAALFATVTNLTLLCFTIATPRTLCSESRRGSRARAQAWVASHRGVRSVPVMLQVSATYRDKDAS